MFWLSGVLCGILALHPLYHKISIIDREHVMQVDEVAQFWEQKRAENQQILDLIDAGTFQLGDGSLIDAATLAAVRQWAAHRVAECAARLAARRADQ
jgi:hypothetical protein